MFQGNQTKRDILADAETVEDPAPFVAVVGDPLSSTTFYLVREGDIILEGVGSVRDPTYLLLTMYYVCMVVSKESHEHLQIPAA